MPEVRFAVVDRLIVTAFVFGAISVDIRRGLVLRDGMPVNLAPKEFQLLEYLIAHRERVITRDELMAGVWQYSAEADSRTVDVHIANIRRKIEPNPHIPRHILTVRAKGYRFIP